MNLGTPLYGFLYKVLHPVKFLNSGRCAPIRQSQEAYTVGPYKVIEDSLEADILEEGDLEEAALQWLDITEGGSL